MKIVVHPDRNALGRAAADQGAAAIVAALDNDGCATVVLATGASQFSMLDHLVAAELDWSRVTAFHLDEYIGLAGDHPASFRRYLRERALDRLPLLGEFVAVQGDAADINTELSRLNKRLAITNVDVCFAGIGENGHLAFNDPPADLDTRDPYIVVDLDERCRRQQLNEGWFRDLASVPGRAISMSIAQIMKSKMIVVSVPDLRKAEAVGRTVHGSIGPDCPATVLRQHPDATLHLDPASASAIEAA